MAIAASVWGLTLLLDKVRLRVLLPRMAAALVGGMLLAKVLSALTPGRPNKSQGVLGVSLQVTWPWLAVLLIAGAVAVLLRYTASRELALGLGLLVVFGVCSVWTPETVLTTLGDKVCVSGPERPECRHPRRQIPAGGAEAARYIRDNSAVDDRLATNSHCTPVYDPKKCDARNFWLSAYAERRVLTAGGQPQATAQRCAGFGGDRDQGVAEVVMTVAADPVQVGRGPGNVLEVSVHVHGTATVLRM